MKAQSLILFLLSAFCWAAASAQQDTAYYDVTLTVDATVRPGTYPTVQLGVDTALEFASNGKSVRVLVAPGIYREYVSAIGDRAKTYAPIAIEGSSSDDVIISGADVIEGWQLNGDTFETAWAQDKGTVPHLFVQGARVEYVPNASKLSLGQARLRDGGKRIEMLPPRNGVVTEGTVEMGVRPQLLHVVDLPDVTVKGISFVHGAVQVEDAPAALAFQTIQKLRLQNLRIEGNGYGLFVQQARDLELAGVHCLRNRLGGTRLYWCSNIRILGGSYNLNGLGAPEGDPDAVGLATRKSQGLELQRVSVNENRKGLALRYASKDTTLKSVQVYLNHTLGAELTAIDNLDLVGGQFACEGSEDLVTLTGVRGTIRNTFFVADGGKTPLVKVDGSGHLAFKDNIVAAFDHKGPIFELGGIVTLEAADKNLYYSDETERAFVFKGDKLELDDWQSATEQDTHSLWGDPLFTARQRFDFSLRPGSPWFQR